MPALQVVSSTQNILTYIRIAVSDRLIGVAVHWNYKSTINILYMHSPILDLVWSVNVPCLIVYCLEFQIIKYIRSSWINVQVSGILYSLAHVLMGQHEYFHFIG